MSIGDFRLDVPIDKGSTCVVAVAWLKLSLALRVTVVESVRGQAVLRFLVQVPQRQPS